MKLVKGVNSLQKTLMHPVVTIGNFDGVHLGHREIIATAVTQAQNRQGVAVVFTFRPHPQLTLRPEMKLELLSTYEERADLIAAAGVDYLIEEPFSREFSTTLPEQFFTDVLLRRLNAEAIVVGYDFAFGKGRTGHLDALQKWCQKDHVELTVIPPLRIAGEIISSSRIRKHLLLGEIEKANYLLGREFFYRGTVLRGEGRGHHLGFPTANIKPDNKLILPYGVYASWTVWNGTVYPSVTNVGIRPTFQPVSEDKYHQELPALVETHLLGEDLDLYGGALEIRFVKRLREERKFAGVDALRKQIEADILLTKSALKLNI